jgi:hypothetical protein
MNNFNSFLRNLTAQTSIEKVLADLEQIKNRKAIIQSDQQVASDEKTLDTTIETVKMLRDEVYRLSSLVNLYELEKEKDVETIQALTYINITDYKSAYDATTFYDKIWFSKQGLGEEAKISLASNLLLAIQMYCTDNVETLKLIANRNFDMMQFISYPRKDD